MVSLCAVALPAVGQSVERLDPIPEGPESVLEALSPFTADLDSSRVADLLAQETRTGFPASDYDRVLVARLWRLASETELAAASLNRIPAGSDAFDLAVYEAARVWFEDGRTGRGARAYWLACRSLDERVRAEIGWDLLPVTTPRERDAWAKLPSGDPTCQWIRRFWKERAVRSAMDLDERLMRHFQRRAEARERFQLTRPRVSQGMADAYGRPAGLAVDDRGLLWIRLGQPHADVSCPEQVSPADDPPNLLGRCWVYGHPKGYRIFYLSTRDRFGAELPYGDYRIQETLGQQAEPGTEFFQKYVLNADLPESVKRRLVERGPAFRNAKLSQAGIVGTVPDSLTGDLDLAEFLALRHELRDATRAVATEVLEQVPDVPRVASTVQLRYEPLRFLNPTSDRWHVWLLTSVRSADLTASASDEDANVTLDATGSYVMLHDDALMEGTLSDVSIPLDSVPEGAGLTLRGTFESPPGEVVLTVVIEDLNAPGTGAWVQDTLNVPSIGGLPQLSDIAVAQAEGGTWTRDGETFLQVSPAHITNPDGSIHTYFEVYGVDPDTRYEVELRLAPTRAAERIWRLEPDDLAFRLQFTSEMPGEIGRHHLRLDLADTEPGEYTLAVRIQDEETEAYSLPSVTEVYVAERD